MPLQGLDQESVVANPTGLLDNPGRGAKLKVIIPILLGHGKDDPNVHMDQSRNMAKALRRLGASFEFCDPIAARDASRHIHHYDEREFLLNCGQPATEGEISCYASHLALWQQCAQGDDPYLILEDDAALDESFPAGLLVVASQIQEF